MFFTFGMQKNVNVDIMVNVKMVTLSAKPFAENS